MLNKMTSKVLFSVFVALLAAQVALAIPELCPDPSDANQLVYKQIVQEVGPAFGRIEKVYYIPPLQNEISCILLTGPLTGSISAIGVSEDGIKIRLVSDVKRGFEAEIEVYTKEVI